WQWNGGVQMALPWATIVDIEYVGEHAYNVIEGVDINAPDFGAAFLAANQDPTLSSATPGAAAVQADQMRLFRGYSSITQNLPRGWLTSHSLQLSFTRRFRDGLSFGFNDAILLSQKTSTAARLQHNPDGTFSERADQAEADKLLGDFIPNRHLFKGSFVWDLPDIHRSGSTLNAIGWLANDWQLSGVWSASTGGAYTVGVSYQGGATGRNTNMSLVSPVDGTQANLPFDANGNVIASRSQPKSAGFGVANGYQSPRTIQAQIRFSF